MSQISRSSLNLEARLAKVFGVSYLHQHLTHGTHVMVNDKLVGENGRSYPVVMKTHDMVTMTHDMVTVI